MPKKRKQAETFDEHVGDAVENAMNSARLTQVTLAERAGMPTTNLGRGIRGTRPFTVSEFERVAGAVGVPAHEILEAALTNYGGMPKLLAEHVRTSDAADTVTDDGNVTHLDGYRPPRDVAADDNPRADPKD